MSAWERIALVKTDHLEVYVTVTEGKEDEWTHVIFSNPESSGVVRVRRDEIDEVAMALWDSVVPSKPVEAFPSLKPLEEIDRGLPGMVYDEDGNDASISGKPGIYIRRESVGTLPSDSYHEYDSLENCTKCGKAFFGLGDSSDDKTFCDGRRPGVIATLECREHGHPSGEHLHALDKIAGTVHCSMAAGESASSMERYRKNYTFIPGVFRKLKS